jgi:hypothetical protein
MTDSSSSPCPCGDPADPQVVTNPPGLDQISYQVDDFTGFRRAMLRPLPGEQAIGAWRPAPGDLGLQVLEWWAYLAQILVFYNERNANESYLRTATWPGSLANLVALLGYQPGPGIAATGSVAVTRTTAYPNEPLIIPAGMQLSSVATPGVAAQAFEVSTGTSFPGVSGIPVTLAPDTSLHVNADGTPQSVLLAGRVSGIKAGDQLLLAESGFAGADDNWALVTVGSVTPSPDQGTGTVNTLVSFSSGSWGPTTPPATSAITYSPGSRPVAEQPRVTFAERAGAAGEAAASSVHFDVPSSYHWTPGPYHWTSGPQPAAPASLPSTSYQLLRPAATAALWNLSSSGANQAAVVPGPPVQVHLSAAVRAISPGDTVLFEGGDGSPLALGVVTGVSEQFFAVPYPGSASTSLPSPWTDTDVGAPAVPGSASFANGVFTVAGAGADIWGGSDQFNYVWQTLTGEGSIVARVTSQSDTSSWAKCGVIVKQSTQAGSAYALLAVTPGNGMAFQYGYADTVAGGAYSFPDAWLKLTWNGSGVSAYTSSDGNGWTKVGDSQTINMSAPVTIGLFACSHNAGAASTATFDNVSVTPPGSSSSLGIPVAHTVLTLALTQQDATALSGVTDASTVAVRYAFKAAGTLIGVPAPTLDGLPATVTVPASWPAPSVPATAFLQDATGAGVPVLVSGAGPDQVTLTGAGAPPATITTPLAVPLQLLLDVVPVSRGTTVTGEVIGSGNAALINQSFTLAKSPLTYLASGSEPAAQLTVYVNGIAWQQVTSFYGQPPGAQVYVITRSADQSVTTITFGDGVNGARLTSGAGNVVATYRYGSGAASPPAGRLTAISQPQPNLASIQNPVAVSGGQDPQAAADVRADAPASVFTFGRAISAIDYEVIAAQAPGVSRVTAYWTFDGAQQRTVVTVYVGDNQAAVTAATAALAGSDDPNRPVQVLAATPIDISLSCTLVVAADRQVPAVVAAATAAICDGAGGLFSPASMGIGQRLYRSAIDAALTVPGVIAVHNLDVTWPQALSDFLILERRLDEFFDPGEGSFFDLPADSISIIGVQGAQGGQGAQGVQGVQGVNAG